MQCSWHSSPGDRRGLGTTKAETGSGICKEEAPERAWEKELGIGSNGYWNPRVREFGFTAKQAKTTKTGFAGQNYENWLVDLNIGTNEVSNWTKLRVGSSYMVHRDTGTVFSLSWNSVFEEI